VTAPSAWLHPAKAECVAWRWLPAGHPPCQTQPKCRQAFSKSCSLKGNQIKHAFACPAPLAHGILLPEPGQRLQSLLSGVISRWPRLTLPTPFHSLHPAYWELPAGFCTLEVPWACFPWGLLLCHSIQLSPRRLWWKLLFPRAARWPWEHTRFLVNIWGETSVKPDLGKRAQSWCLDQSTWKTLSSKKLQAQGLSWRQTWPKSS